LYTLDMMGQGFLAGTDIHDYKSYFVMLL